MRISRLSQITSRGHASPRVEPAATADRVETDDSASSRTVEVVVYAEDCVLAGRITLTAERLSDMLNEIESFEMRGVRVEDLAGSPAFELETIEVSRTDVLLVHAGAPRGNPGRRHRTRQLAIEAKSGPFLVRGYVHSLPGADAMANLRRRAPMFAVTDAVLEYTVQSRLQQRRAGVLILNREAIDWIVEGHSAHAVPPELPDAARDPRAKDFTGEVFELDADWNA